MDVAPLSTSGVNVLCCQEASIDLECALADEPAAPADDPEVVAARPKRLLRQPRPESRSDGLRYSLAALRKLVLLGYALDRLIDGLDTIE